METSMAHITQNRSHFQIFLFLLNLYSFVSAMESELEKSRVALPSQEVLLKRLEPIKQYKHFLENSTFIKEFANQNKYAAEVFMVLGFDIEEYGKRFKKNGTFKLEMLKPRVVTLMLQDHPNAIAFLKKENVLAEIVQLPDEETLRQRLNSAGFDHLVSHSKITQKLADQQKYPTEIYLIAAKQTIIHANRLGHPMLKNLMLFSIPKITQIILQKHPDAIEWLIKDNIIEATDTNKI